MLDAQRRFGVVVGCGHNDHGSDPIGRTIKRMIDAGELGRIVAFEATTAHSGGFHLTANAWRADPEKNPGGMLFQCGVHKFHELMYYLGSIADIACTMRFDVHDSPTADVACCLVRFASGVCGSLNAYHVSPSRATTNIFGTRQSIYCNEHPWGAGGVWIQSCPPNYDRSPEPVRPLEIDTPTHPLAGELGNLVSFHRAVTQGGEPYPSIMDGARAVAAVFAADHSARTGGGFVPVKDFL